MATLTLEKVGRRIYFRGNTFPVKDALRNIGAKPEKDDEGRWHWYIGSGKEAEAKTLVESLAASVAATDPNAPKKQQDPDDIRLTGKAVYKGRSYYMGSKTRDGNRVRLLTLPDANGKYLDFWADVKMIEIERTYEVRMVWNGIRGRGSREIEKHTTLGSIADFISRQRNPETAREQCQECDSWKNVGEACRDCGGC